jgi:hypothetical protein
VGEREFGPNFDTLNHYHFGAIRVGPMRIDFSGGRITFSDPVLPRLYSEIDFGSYRLQSKGPDRFEFPRK